MFRNRLSEKSLI